MAENANSFRAYKMKLQDKDDGEDDNHPPKDQHLLRPKQIMSDHSPGLHKTTQYNDKGIPLEQLYTQSVPSYHLGLLKTAHYNKEAAPNMPGVLGTQRLPSSLQLSTACYSSGLLGTPRLPLPSLTLNAAQQSILRPNITESSCGLYSRPMRFIRPQVFRRTFQQEPEKALVEPSNSLYHTHQSVPTCLPRIIGNVVSSGTATSWCCNQDGFLQHPDVSRVSMQSHFALNRFLYAPYTDYLANHLLPNLLYPGKAVDPTAHQQSSGSKQEVSDHRSSPKRETKMPEDGPSPPSSDYDGNHKSFPSPDSLDSGYSGAVEANSLPLAPISALNEPTQASEEPTPKRNQPATSMNEKVPVIAPPPLVIDKPSPTIDDQASAIEETVAVENNSAPDMQRKEKKPRIFKCQFCQRSFAYGCHKRVHERVHTGEKPYICNFCNQCFSQLGSLTVHIRIHTGDKPYHCPDCGKKFRHVNSLRRHQRQVHNMTTVEIAASIRDSRAEEEPSKSSDVRDHKVIEGPIQHQRRNRLSPRQLVAPNQVCGRQIIVARLPNRASWARTSINRLSPPGYSSNGEKQGSYPRQTHKSKFLCELEKKTKLHKETNIPKDSDAPPCGFSNSNNLSTGHARKPPAKTWRPFLDDDENNNCKTPASHLIYDPISPAEPSESNGDLSVPHQSSVSRGPSDVVDVTKENDTKAKVKDTKNKKKSHDGAVQKKQRPAEKRKRIRYLNQRKEILPSNAAKRIYPAASNLLNIWPSALSLRSPNLRRRRRRARLQASSYGRFRRPNNISTSPREKDNSDEGFSSSGSVGDAAQGSRNSATGAPVSTLDQTSIDTSSEQGTSTSVVPDTSQKSTKP